MLKYGMACVGLCSENVSAYSDLTYREWATSLTDTRQQTAARSRSTARNGFIYPLVSLLTRFLTFPGRTKHNQGICSQSQRDIPVDRQGRRCHSLTAISLLRRIYEWVVIAAVHASHDQRDPFILAH